MASRRPGKVYVLAVEPPDQRTLNETDADWIVRHVSPGAGTKRYGRDWVIGQTVREGQLLRGRIGYRGAEGTAEVWDDEARDFLEIAVPQGQAVPFAFDLERLRLAIQVRPLLKLNGLIGAFEALLSEEGLRWGVTSPQTRTPFAEWRASVERVTKVRMRVVKPNPTYRGTPDLEHLLESAEAEVAVLEVQSDEGIDTTSDFISQSQAHIDSGYGDARYHGLSDGRESIYNTALGTEESYSEAEVGDDGEVPPEALREAIDDD